MENEEKPQKINLPCSTRISLPSLPPEPGFSFQVFELECFFFNFASPAKVKYFSKGVYFGRLAVTARCASSSATKTFVSESDFAASWEGNSSEQL